MRKITIKKTLLHSPLQPPVSSGPLTVGTIASAKPETYRLPSRGGDPFFGLTRGFYYNAEKLGLLKLIRLRGRGKQRGVTLVPYDQVLAIVKAAQQE